MKRLTLLAVICLIVSASFIASPSTTAHAAVCQTKLGNSGGGFGVIAGSVDVTKGDVVTATITGQRGATATAALGLGGIALSPTRNGSVSFTAPFTGSLNGIFSSFIFVFRRGFQPSPFGWKITVNSKGCTSSETEAGYFGPLFWDGRLNDKDGAETAAVFCEDGNIVIYGMGNPWTIVLKVSPNEVDRVPGMPKVNTLIKQNGAYRLYRLMSGELQVNGPGQDPNNDYYFIFNDCPRNQY